ncbi:MAG: hypothetical protein K2W99_06085 [Chthoniobacterales bacterium]|nr:hypothetical protein [Chthoniobacterales bacterium]
MKKIPLFFLVTLLLIIPLQVMAMMKRGKEGDTTSTEESSREKIKEDSQKEADREIIASIGPTQISSTSLFSVKNVLFKSESSESSESSENISSQEKVPPIMSAPNISSLQPNAQPRSLEEPSSASVEEKRKSPFVLEEDNQRQLRQAMLAEIRNKAQERLQKASSSFRDALFLEEERPVLDPMTSARVTRINFEEVPNEKGKKTQSLNTFKKNKPAKTESDKEFKKKVKAFKNKIIDLETIVEAINDLTDVDSQRSEQLNQIVHAAKPDIESALEKLVPLSIGAISKLDKVAAVYKNAVPEVKEFLQNLFHTMAEETAQELDKQQEQALMSSLPSTMQLFEKHLFFNYLTAEAESDQISEEDPDKSSKVAAIYRQTYQEMRPHFEFLLAEINKNPESVNQEVALQLARSGMQLLEVAFKTIDREHMRPIKIQVGIDDDILNARKIPQEPTPYDKLEEEDDEAGYIIYEADNAVTNFKDLIKVFNFPDAEIGAALHKSQYLKSYKVDFIAQKKFHAASRKVTLLSRTQDPSSELLQARKKSNLAYEDLRKCDADYDNLTKATPVIDPKKAEAIAIKEILGVANTIGKTSNQLVLFLENYLNSNL